MSARGARRRLLAAACALLAGCTAEAAPAPVSLLDDRTAEGVPVRELLAADRPNAILAYPAGYCFACAQQIAEWQQLHRAGHVNLVVLLARAPLAAERNALALRRIPVAGVLREERARAEPEEYLVEGGRVLLVSRGATRTGSGSPVLAAIRARIAATPSGARPPAPPAESARS